ncbi:MAG: hypothetical protein Q7S86_01225 [bacterium]|nr:hypothetical protein [bacterium]
MNEETVTEKVTPVIILCLFIAIFLAIHMSPNLSMETFWSFAEILQKLLTVMTISCIGAFAASLCDTYRQR